MATRTTTRFAPLCLALVALSAASSATRLQAQAAPAISGAVYAARHSIGAELQAMVVSQFGLVARAEGLAAVENAYWWGARFDFLSNPDTKAYLNALVGNYRCYPSTLSGTGSGCPYNGTKRKPGATVLAGFELGKLNSRCSVGAEGGSRFVSAGTRSRWTFAATLRYLILP